MLSKTQIKLIKSLTHKKFRNIHKLFVIEGERLVSEVVQSKIITKQVYITDEFVAKPQHNFLMNLIAKNAIVTNAISESEMKSICDTISPPGILAICEIAKSNGMDISISDNGLYLDEIKDPGNLGTLLRSADWFGVKNVALSENCVDVFNTKVLRSGMGSHFRLNLFTNVSLKKFSNSSHTIIGAFQDGENIHKIERVPITPWILVIGNEAHGISTNNMDHINLKVTIPKIGSGESLNAAIAGSILLAQLTRPL